MPLYDDIYETGSNKSIPNNMDRYTPYRPKYKQPKQTVYGPEKPPGYIGYGKEDTGILYPIFKGLGLETPLYGGSIAKGQGSSGYQDSDMPFLAPLFKLFGLGEEEPSSAPVKPPALPSTPNRANTVTRPEGTGTYHPNTGTVPVSRTQGVPSEEIAGRISTENPYGANVNSRDILTDQVRIGAPTDAEAARNLESRVLQDQAAQAEVARLNRATEAMKSLREARSPAFSFGTDVIGRTGGIESKLNEASGRVINSNTPADAIASRMQEAIQSAKTRGLGRRAGLLAAAQIGKAYDAAKELQGIEAQVNKQPTTNPIDMARYLLDQQKFAQQQGVDKARLNIDTGTMQAKQAGTALEQQKYADTQRKDFMENFTAPEGAPRDELAAGVLHMSKVTGLPPDVMNTYLQRVIRKNNIDWENAPPKYLEQLYEKAVALAASENR